MSPQGGRETWYWYSGPAMNSDRQQIALDPRVLSHSLIYIVLLKKRMKSTLLPLLSLVALNLSAANWPQFRGPRASGLDTNSAAPTQWNVEHGENITWQAKIPGLGHSSPIMWG